MNATWGPATEQEWAELKIWRQQMFHDQASRLWNDKGRDVLSGGLTTEATPSRGAHAIRVGGSLAGLLSFDPVRRNFDTIFLHPDFRGQDLGFEITRAVLREILGQGVDVLMSSPSPGMKKILDRLVAEGEIVELKRRASGRLLGRPTR